jgi:electron transport complex protein RnfG
MQLRHILITGILLFLFAVVGATMVAFTFDATEERIAANERALLLRSLNELIPHERHDNDLFADVIEVTDASLLGTDEPVPVYRARKDGRNVAAVLAPVAPDGYGGAIKLLVCVTLDGTLCGVRVVAHKETPGLGDAIEAERSDWILGFTGKSLTDPPEKQWRVERDGGVFDQFTGATITPRAVVKAVRKTLVYFRQHRAQLFRPAPVPKGAAEGLHPTSNEHAPAGTE